MHGNHTTPTDDVLALAGAVVGQPATQALFDGVRERLERSGRFAGVDVRKRYLAIDDPTRVLLVIVVDEHARCSFFCSRGLDARLFGSVARLQYCQRDICSERFHPAGNYGR